MGYKNKDSCLEKAFDDERLFVLMARDSSAPQVIGEWIKMNIGIQPREKLIEALDCAIEMQNRSGEFIKRKEEALRCSCCGSKGVPPASDLCIKCLKRKEEADEARKSFSNKE